MNVYYDRNEPRLIVNQVPVGANKVELEIPEYKLVGVPVEGSLQIGNFKLATECTVRASRVTNVLERVERIDNSGNTIWIEEQHEEVEVLEQLTVELRHL